MAMRSFEYFICQKDYFWILEEDGEVIAIPRGDTIAYSGFVVRVLEDFAGQGLPPFGSLLLAIVGTNPSAKEGIDRIEWILRNKIMAAEGDRVEYRLKVLHDAMIFLQLLSSLPLRYITGDTRIQLFQLLFADCHGRLSKGVSLQIVSGIHQLQSVGNTRVLRTLSQQGEVNEDRILEEFRCIALLLKKFPDTKTLIDRLAGVPHLDEPVLPVEAEETTVPGDFVQALIDHPTTFPVGALIRSLWSGMSIPIHHSLPSEQPLGGFSDLSNKGDLDKLLISEFAADDWLFLSRLANNEALYLHRETPPGADPLERIILVDVSLKSWGTPKVLAYAVLLAIATHPRTDIHCTAYAVGDDYYPITVDSVDAVIQSIQLVDGVLDPAAGLIKFLQRPPAGEKMEVFFIASPDTMRYPAIQKVFSDYYDSFKYWVTVAPEGAISFYRNQHKGRKLIQQLTLPLEELWQSKKSKKGSLSEANTPADKLNVPILFPPPTSAKKIFVGSDFDLFAVTKERNLLRHRREERSVAKGWELVLDEVLPAASFFAMGSHENDAQLFLCFKVHNREVIIIRLDTGESHSVIFNEWKPSPYAEFFFAERVFCYMNEEYIWTFAWGQDIRIQKEKIGNTAWWTGYYEMLQERTEQEKGNISFSWSVLKNIHHVIVNQQGNLVFNKHELVLSKGGHIQLLPASRESRVVTVPSEWDSEHNEFLFPGGNKIRVLRSGMLVLQRAETATVYIPAALDTSLAAATDTHFTGNPYYYPAGSGEPLIKINATTFYEENIRSFIRHILKCS